MITRDAARRRRRPLSGAHQVATMTEAIRAVNQTASDARPETVTDQVFWTGYAQAMRDLASEIADRQEALRRRSAK